VLGSAVTDQDGNWSVPGSRPLTTYLVRLSTGVGACADDVSVTTDQNGNDPPSAASHEPTGADGVLICGWVEGHVLDASTHAPIAGATVDVLCNWKSPATFDEVGPATTDRRGHFLVNYTGYNEQCEVKASATGYRQAAPATTSTGPDGYGVAPVDVYMLRSQQ